MASSLPPLRRGLNLAYVFALIDRRRRVVGKCRRALAVTVIFSQDARMRHCITGLILAMKILGFGMVQQLLGVHCSREW